MPRKSKAANIRQKRDRDRKRLQRNRKKQNNEVCNDSKVTSTVDYTANLESKNKHWSDSSRCNPQTTEVSASASMSCEVIQGSFHQGSHIFQPENIGRQCSCNSVAALCLLRTVPSTIDIDNVLLQGDQLYTLTVQYLKEQGTFKSNYLTVDELLTNFNLGNLAFDLIKHESMFGLVYDQDTHSVGLTLVESFNRLFADTEIGILIIKSYMLAVFKSAEGLFALFDPHSRNIDGESTPQGKSIWMGFSSVELLTLQIQRLCRSIDECNFQYELTPITISSGRVNIDKIKSSSEVTKPVTRAEKRKYFYHLKYKNDPIFREQKQTKVKEKYVKDKVFRESCMGASRKKYKADEQYQELIKKTYKRKYAEDETYKIHKKQASITKYSQNLQHKEAMKKASTTKYAEDTQHKEAVKKASTTKYAENTQHKEAVKKASTTKYAEDTQHKEAVKKASTTKYAEDAQHKEAVKKASTTKYAEDTQHKEAVKKASTTKYAEDAQHKEAVKKASATKYAEDTQHKEAKKKASATKYAEDTQHKEAKKKASAAKYAQNKPHKEAVKKASTTKYAEDKKHKDAVKKTSTTKYAENRKHKEAMKKASATKYAEDTQHKEAKKKASAAKYAQNKPHKEAVKKASITKYAEDKKHKEAVKKASTTKYAEDKQHKETVRKASIHKYSENVQHQEAVKQASIGKYAKDNQQQERVKQASIRKYTENKEHREYVKQASKNKYMSLKKAKESFTHCLETFKNDCSVGPAYPCTSCNRLMFRNGVIPYHTRNYTKSQSVRDIAQKCAKATYVHICDKTCREDCSVKQSSYGQEWICHTCSRYFKKAQVPPEAEENALKLSSVPPEISTLNTLEQQLISLVIPFIKLINLPKGGQKGIKGPAVCVPADLGKVQNIFPRRPSESEFIRLKLKRKLQYKGHYSYQKIRILKVKTALLYLKDQNPFYKDIEIDENWLNTLNDELVEENKPLQHDSSDSEDDDEPTLQEHGVLFDTCLQPVDPGAEPQALQNAMENIYSLSPCEGNKPVYFSSDPTIEMKCFPYLFPSGKFGYDAKRAIKLSATKYFNSRIMNADSRFARDASYIFFSQYMTERDQISNSISIAQRKSNRNMKDGRKITAKMLTNQQNVQEILQSNTAFRFLQPVRGTPSYWERTLKDLFAAVRQLGIPTWFATFSAADFRWPEIITAIALQHGQVIDFDSLSWEEKCEFLKLNPVTAARMFDHRVKSFINNIIKSPTHPIGKVVDFFYRVEFQARGSPHIHCLFWVENAPKYGESSDEEFIQFVDQYTTCKLPDQNSEKELHDIVTKVQMHSQKHTKTCKKGNSECRFGFPKPPSKHTFIAKPISVSNDRKCDENDDTQVQKNKSQAKLNHLKICLKNLQNASITTEQFFQEAGLDDNTFESIYIAASSRESIVLKRNIDECWIKNYNKELILAWNGNIDFQPVFDAYSCIMYMLSYISKSEKAMSRLLECAKKEAEEENQNLKEQMKKLGSVYLTHREVSVQEAVYRVLSIPLKQLTREVVFVPAHPNCTRMTMPLNQIKRKADEEEDSPFLPNIVDKYLARPIEETFQDLCLADFVSLFKVATAQYTSNEYSEEQQKAAHESKKPKALKYTLRNGLGVVQKRAMNSNAVIRFPRFSKSKKTEDHYYVLLKLYLPHYNDKQLKPEGFDTFEDFYTKGSVKLTNSDVIQPVCIIVEGHRQEYEKNVEEIESAEKAYFEATELEDAWALLAPTTEVSRAEQEEEMASQLIDEDDVLVADLNDITTDRRGNHGKESGDSSETRKIHISTAFSLRSKNVSHKMRQLNEKQQQIFYAVRKWCLLKSQGRNPDPINLLVHASGGCGKSFLIETLFAEASKILDKKDQIEQNRVVLTAPTGVAAFNINGLTLHKCLHLPIQMRIPYVPLGEDIINQLRCEIGEIQLLIIDEISMVSQVMLSYINGHLNQIKQSRSSEVFGGISILAFGDFYQLPPVKGVALYKNPKHIVDLWKDNFKIVTLTEIMRQKDREDAETLCRLRVKKKKEKLNEHDYLKLQSRTKLVDLPKTALHIFPKNKDVDQHNKKMVAVICKKTITLQATDTVKLRGKYFRKKHCLQGSSNDLADKIEIGIGAKVMLMRNLDLTQGLVNGAFGQVTRLLMEEDGINCRAVCVHFDNNAVGMQEKLKYKDDPNVPKDSICIFAIDENMQQSSIIRRQFPLRIAFACTIHKVQGITADSIVVSLKGTFAAGMGYVALSRVRSLSGLYLLDEIDRNMSEIFCADDIEKHLETMTECDLLEKNIPRIVSQSCFTVIHHNIEGLNAHFMDLQNAFLGYADIICLSETWTDKTDTCNLLNSYTLIQKDRKECRHYSQDAQKGGVGIYIKGHIQYEEITLESMKEIECLAVHIPSISGMIMTVYRSPTYKKSLFAKHLENILLDIQKTDQDIENIVIAGDFNENVFATEKKIISSLFQSYGYRQMIEEPTTLQGTLLDLVFVKTESDVNCMSGVLQSYYSYHEPVFCKLLRSKQLAL